MMRVPREKREAPSPKRKFQKKYQDWYYLHQIRLMKQRLRQLDPPFAYWIEATNRIPEDLDPRPLEKWKLGLWLQLHEGHVSPHAIHIGMDKIWGPSPGPVDGRITTTSATTSSSDLPRQVVPSWS
ncbi:hypothetical protein H6P81_008095 [Aristolochia fimbriata]|uniref:Ycf15 n=1 Tax=Aristolochia fimbriata TaxID=158543 RepID=A0AAV7F5S5_ARIFI|nr:hypothetical protein H6P81_008095 [Aristolochia fimbriata]